jgi:hypothetical protein
MILQATEAMNGMPTSFFPAPVLLRKVHMAIETPIITAKKTTSFAKLTCCGTVENASGQLEMLLPLLLPPPPRLGAMMVCLLSEL